MGAVTTMVALGLAAAAAGAQYQNTRRVQKKQDREAAAGVRARGERQRQADAEVSKLIDRTSKSSPDAAEGGILGKYLDQIKMNTGAANSGLQQVGATSDAYKQSGADASLGINDYGTRVAGLLSRMDAPGMQRQEEAIDRGRFASEIDRIKRFSAGDDFLSQLRMQGIRRNPWLDAFSAFAGGASGSVAGGWGSSAPSAGATNVGNSFFTNGGLSGIGY